MSKATELVEELNKKQKEFWEVERKENEAYAEAEKQYNIRYGIYKEMEKLKRELDELPEEEKEGVEFHKLP